jgi:hypothetical protein
MWLSLAGNKATDGVWRSEVLWVRLEICRTFFDAYLAVRVESLPCLPSSGTLQLLFATVTVSRLLSLDDSGRDVDVARSVLV